MDGRLRPLEPDQLVTLVRDDLERVIALHTGPATEPQRPRRERAAAEDTAPSARGQGPVAPERFALLQAMLAFLLERCGDQPSATVSTDDMRHRFHLTQQELQEHLDLLNLVNFGGGCYAVYCWTENGSVQIDKELYGDTFRRPARLSPLEAKALLRALDVVAPVIAAESHSSLQTVREKVAAAFGQFTLADTPEPHEAGNEESTVTTLNEGARHRRLVRIGYHSRSSNDFSERVIEPYLLRRDERGWYLEAYDRTKDGRRTFKVSYVRDAELLDEAYEPRDDMRDLDPQLGGEVGTARVLFSPARARYEREGRHDVTMLTGGAALAAVSYGSLTWLVPEILKHRGEAEVLDPRTCARACARPPIGCCGRSAGRRRRADPLVGQRDPRVSLQVAAVVVGDVEPAVAFGQLIRLGLQPVAEAAGTRRRPRPAQARRRAARRRGSRGTRPGRCRSRTRGLRTPPRTAAPPAVTATGRTGSGGRRARRRRRWHRSGRRRCRPGTRRRRPRPAAPAPPGWATARRR